MKATIITNRTTVTRSIRKMSTNTKRTALHLFFYMKQHGFNGQKVRINHWENPVTAYMLKDLILQIFPECNITVNVDESLPLNPAFTNLVVAY